MDLIWIILLILVGLVLIAIEVIAIPGIPIMGIAGLIMVGFGIFNTYSEYGTLYGNITLIASIISAVLIFLYFLRSKTWKIAQLNHQIDSKVNLIDESKIVQGAKGKTLSRLAPMGNALIEGEVVEVQALNDFIEEDNDIEVAYTEGNKVYVKRTLNNKL